ncbi:co-chaperone DjlA [Pseudoalteromonas sp. JBTF-M23]|uniref:Co-chaperone protein DjlA n=1 Tax=Pseudoalteromonas caenipelagi TaxID=2726988 RepID=A0A849VHX1_9GAMM|nr:co-chaperone DjlA [Pseudoalteromonas caenipelagi]NOU52420.1 co-chaperone DjlA [Pseudoalteromonas caenipelagi]
MWGKLLGICFGFMFGRWIGAILGFWLGHMFDKSLKQNFDKVGGFQGFFSGDDLHQRQALFFSSCFAVMGHIAKSNGRVSEIHIQAATAFMDEMGLHGENRQEAQNAFRAGKEPEFKLKEAIVDFKEVFARRYDLLQLFLEIQIQMAFSDGHLAAQEKQLLQKVSQYLGISATHFRFILKRYQAEFSFRQQQQRFQQSQQNHYQRKERAQPEPEFSKTQALAVLGLQSDASEKDIKRAYRKLMAQHHPDKLVSQGLPEHMMEVAKRKSQDIQSAYEFLKKAS